MYLVAHLLPPKNNKNKGNAETYELFSTLQVERREIMGSIQLGIQQAISNSKLRVERELFGDDFMEFDPNIFEHSGSNPPHKYSEFTFTTYASTAFSYFRDMYGIQTQDFLVCTAFEFFKKF